MTRLPKGTLTARALIAALSELPLDAPVVRRDEDGYYIELNVPYETKTDKWQLDTWLKNRVVVVVE